MGIGDLFRSIHATLDVDNDLCPINDEEREFVKGFNLNPNNFYRCKNRFFRYCYFKDTVFVEVDILSEKCFEIAQIPKRISKLTKFHKGLIEKKNYDYLMLLVDKPIRPIVFKNIYKNIPKKDKYDIFLGVYISMEYGFNMITRDMLEDIYKHKKMDSDYFDEDEIVIYRGEGSKSRSYKEAFSWTTNINVAKMFANRFEEEGIIYKGKVNTKDILDFIQNRNESEILVFPENVYDICKYEIERD